MQEYLAASWQYRSMKFVKQFPPTQNSAIQVHHLIILCTV